MPKGSQSSRTDSRGEAAPDMMKTASSSGGCISNDYHDWPLDSFYDSRNITSTSDMEDFMATLSGPTPLVNLPAAFKRDAKEMEAAIQQYVGGAKLETADKCLLAQDILRYGIERSQDLMDELYLQLLKHLRGGNKTTSVRGWELLLLAACAARPSNKFMEPVNNFVHAVSHTKAAFPTTVAILAKRTWAALKHASKPGSRVNVPSAGEIESVLSSKTMKVQITFVDGSNKWLFYDWTTTVAAAVEQLAAQIGLKNYKEYTLFEVKKVPKKLDTDGVRSIATLPPDSYLLLEDGRRVAEVLQDYEARGAQNKLLLKRKRFDTSDADFSKPQFIALTTAHQAAMDEKIAEVANLTLRLREMSGKVAWVEAVQGEHAAEVQQLRQRAQAAEARVKEMVLQGVSVEVAEVIRERDALDARVKQLQEAAAVAQKQAAAVQLQGDWRPMGLVQKLLQQQAEAEALQAELVVLRASASPADAERAAAAGRAAAQSGSADKDATEKEALYDLLKLQRELEEDHAEEIALRDEEIENLKESLAALANSGGGGGGGARLANGHAGVDPAELQRLVAENAALEEQLDALRQQLREKEGELRGCERDWRQQLNAARSEAAALASRLKGREVALEQASGEVEELHRQAGRLRSELDDKAWELDRAAANLQAAQQERDAAQAKLAAAAARGVSGGSTSAAALVRSASRGEGGQDQLIAELTSQLELMAADRDAAVEKLAGIQQLMFGAAGENGARKVPERGVRAKAINASCPLEAGRDPRRETVGGASVPVHLRGVQPARVKPDAQGGRFTPAFRNPALERREAAQLQQEAEARRRAYRAEVPLPAKASGNNAVNERINSGSHLLGLLSNGSLTRTQDLGGDAEDSILSMGGPRADMQGPLTPELATRAGTAGSGVDRRQRSQLATQ